MQTSDRKTRPECSAAHPFHRDQAAALAPPCMTFFGDGLRAAREQTVSVPIGIATTPAAMPDGPPSRKGPLCSVLSPLPVLYFYCKDPRSPTRRNRFRKTLPFFISHSP